MGKNLAEIIEKILQSGDKIDNNIKKEMINAIKSMRTDLNRKKKLKDIYPDDLPLDISAVMSKQKKFVLDKKINLDSATIIKGIPKVSGIDQIRSIIEFLIKSVQIINPLIEAAKSLDPNIEYNQMLDILKKEYVSDFLLPDALQFQSYLSGCIKEFSSIMNKADKKGYLSNANTRLDFLVVKGAISEIYHLINPAEGKLMVEDEFQGNDFFKPAHEILLTLASLSALDLGDNTSKAKTSDDIKTDVLGLNESERRIVVGMNIQPHWVLDQGEDVQRKIFNLIATNVEEGIVLQPEEMNSIFGRMEKSMRERFIRLILSSLTMSEMKYLENLINKGA